MKWQNDVIGRKLPMNPSWAQLQEQPTIVGVVDDVRNMGFLANRLVRLYSEQP